MLDLSVRGLLATWATLGHDLPTLFAQAGIDAARFDGASTEQPPEVIRTLWATALTLSGEPTLGLQVAQALPFGLYKVLEFLAGNSPTIGEGVARVARYMGLATTAMRMEIDQVEGLHRVALRPLQPGFVQRPLSDYALALMVLRGRYAFDHPLPLAKVTFAEPPPPSVAAYEEAFGCAVLFGAADTALWLTEAVWQAPVTGSTPALFAAIEAHARALLDERTPPTTRALRTALGRALRGGSVELGAVARGLGMSGRTLQRRLRGEGTTFAAELDAMRHQLAARYLGEPDVTLAEISDLLGFSEPPAFTRAFRRWTGQTPAAWRRGQRRGGVVP